MHDPEYYRRPPQELRADSQRNEEIETLLLEKLERWTELEKKT